VGRRSDPPAGGFSGVSMEDQMDLLGVFIFLMMLFPYQFGRTIAKIHKGYKKEIDQT
jgi:hypothetical protein